VGEGGLAQAGQVFNQQVSAGQQCHEGQAHFRGLAQYQRVDLILGLAKGAAQRIG